MQQPPQIRLCAVCILVFFLWPLSWLLWPAPKAEKTGEPAGTLTSFDGSILEIHDDSYLLDVVYGNDALESGSQVEIPAEAVETPQPLQVGDALYVTYEAPTPGGPAPEDSLKARPVCYGTDVPQPRMRALPQTPPEPRILPQTPSAPMPDTEIHSYYQYITPPGGLPYALFSPVGARDQVPLPLIISLHGASEVGRSEKTFRNKFLVKEFRNWESTGLDGIQAYIVCPHLSGGCKLDSWNNPKAAELLFDLIDDLVATHNIDPDRIAIQGHSLGGQGALYMAAQPRAKFCAVAVVSGFEPYTDLSAIHAPIRGYIGTPGAGESRTSSRYMKKLFANRFGSENLFIRSVSHDQIPITAFREDLDGDNKSDLVEWMFSR